MKLRWEFRPDNKANDYKEWWTVRITRSGSMEYTPTHGDRVGPKWLWLLWDRVNSWIDE